MSTTLRKFVNFLHRPLPDKVLVAQTYLLLGLSKLAIRLLSMHRLTRFFGTQKVETAQEAPPEHLREARRIAWAISSVSPYTPWNSNCYPQAITAKYLLRRRRIPCTLYLGAAFKKEKEEGLEAHAWLRCGSIYVTGGKGHEQFGTVGIFGL